MNRLILPAALLLLLPSMASALPPGNPAKGKQIFNTCHICHNLGPNATIKIGPPLNGVVGRPWASWPGFAYSAGLQKGKKAGNVWTVARLDKWLTNPRADVPGTKMIFPGLQTAQQRADVIAYLKQFDIKGNKK
ncbi:MAG: cytochrome c family protein [Pseudolabrys sp.]|jgi:cytochrome c